MVAALLTLGATAPRAADWAVDLPTARSFARLRRSPLLVAFVPEFSYRAEAIRETLQSEVVLRRYPDLIVAWVSEEKSPLANRLRVRAAPTLVVFDSSGREQGRIAGFHWDDVLVDALSRMERASRRTDALGEVERLGWRGQGREAARRLAPLRVGADPARLADAVHAVAEGHYVQADWRNALLAFDEAGRRCPDRQRRFKCALRSVVCLSRLGRSNEVSARLQKLLSDRSLRPKERLALLGLNLANRPMGLMPSGVMGPPGFMGMPDYGTRRRRSGR